LTDFGHAAASETAVEGVFAEGEAGEIRHGSIIECSMQNAYSVGHR
jgi:hypothetical protein